MAKLLFALEEIENENTDLELETSVEEGETADVQVEMDSDVSDIEEMSEGVSEGDEAADQLEEVQELVEASAEEGEGLSPIAAEAVRIAVEAICARVGADPKQMGMYSLYANENFQSSSSRKANTVIAAEGIGEFLKELWEKIKAAVSALWTKVTAFWNKHVSSLGRVKKALESMQKKVAASKGNLKGDGTLEKIPTGLANAFPGNGDLDNGRVVDYIKAHANDSQHGEMYAVTATITSNVYLIKKNITEAAIVLNEYTSGVNNFWGSESAPLIGGVWFKATVEGSGSEYEYKIEMEQVDSNSTDGELDIASKNQMKALIKSTLDVIKDTSKVKTEMDKLKKEFDKTMSAAQDVISLLTDANNEDSKEKMKSLRGVLRDIRVVNNVNMTHLTKNLSLNIKLAKSVLGYVSVCLKQYK